MRESLISLLMSCTFKTIYTHTIVCLQYIHIHVVQEPSHGSSPGVHMKYPFYMDDINYNVHVQCICILELVAFVLCSIALKVSWFEYIVYIYNYRYIHVQRQLNGQMGLLLLAQNTCTYLHHYKYNESTKVQPSACVHNTHAFISGGEKWPPCVVAIQYRKNSNSATEQIQ